MSVQQLQRRTMPPQADGPVHALFEVIEQEFGVPHQQLDLDMSLADDLGADSLDMLALIIALEKRFDVTVSDEVTSFKTPHDLVVYVRSSGGNTSAGKRSRPKSK